MRRHTTEPSLWRLYWRVSERSVWEVMRNNCLGKRVKYKKFSFSYADLDLLIVPPGIKSVDIWKCGSEAQREVDVWESDMGHPPKGGSWSCADVQGRPRQKGDLNIWRTDTLQCGKVLDGEVRWFSALAVRWNAPSVHLVTVEHASLQRREAIPAAWRNGMPWTKSRKNVDSVVTNHVSSSSSSEGDPTFLPYGLLMRNQPEMFWKLELLHLWIPLST